MNDAPARAGGRAWLWLAAALSLASAALLAGTDIPDPDAWWNTYAGSVLVRTGHDAPLQDYGAHQCMDALPLVMTVPHTAIGIAWELGREWGLVGLRALCAMVFALAVFVRLRRTPAAALLWTVVAVGGLAFRLSPRAELIAFVLLAAQSSLLASLHAAASDERTRGDLRPRNAVLALLVVSQALFVYTHALALFAFVIPVAVLVGGMVLRSERRALVERALPLAAIGIGTCARPGIVFDLQHATVETRIAGALGFREFEPLVSSVLHGFIPSALAPWAVFVALVVSGAVMLLARRDARTPETLGAVLGGMVFVLLSLTVVRAIVYLPVVAPALVTLLPRLPPALRRALTLGAVCAGLLVAIDRVPVDPVLTSRAARDRAPTRLMPLGASDFLARTLPRTSDGATPDARPLVFTSLHAGNYLVLHNHEQARVVWSGRRTYTEACGRELLAARGGAVAFERIDARLAPDFVLAHHATEPALVTSLIASGWRLAYVDLRDALFARPGTRPANAHAALDVDVGRMLDLENRPLDPTLAAGLLQSTCGVLERAAREDAGAVCALAAGAADALAER